MLKILITGNCLRYSIASQLLQWVPDLKIVSLATPINDAEALRLKQALIDADVWISMGLSNEVLKDLINHKTPAVKTLRIPTIGFAAFQPDICFLTTDETGKTAQPVFNSAIGAWAFCNQLSRSEAALLFNVKNFAALGYLDAWQSSVTYLRESFAQSDLSNDFAAFFYSVKRHGDGCFMHSFNHPTGFAIAELCRLICKRINVDVSDWAVLPDMNNPATQTQWPVYPEIARTLGLGSGGYHWKIYDQVLDGLNDYLDWQFSQYCNQGFTPETLKLVNRDAALMSRVLNS